MRIILAAALTALVLGAAPAGAGSDRAKCEARCHAEKSRAYRRCRAIPPAERARRRACFERADAALERCLSRCR